MTQKLITALVEEVKRHAGGVDALALRAELEELGYDSREIQAAMRQSLDEGTLRLGPKLRLTL